MVILPSIWIATISKFGSHVWVKLSHSRSNRFCVSDNDVFFYVTVILIWCIKQLFTLELLMDVMPLISSTKLPIIFARKNVAPKFIRGRAQIMHQGVANSLLSDSHSVGHLSVGNRSILFIKCKISRLSEIIKNIQS